MSGQAFRSYETSYKSHTSDYSTDTGYKERTKRLESARAETSNKTREKRTTEDLYDKKLVKNKITSPAPEVERVHLVIIDNSGSNAEIARHLRETSGYFMGILNQIDPMSQIAWMYYSDHSDGNRCNQEIDFLSPNQEGDKALYSSLQHVVPASGGDEAEAFECALWDACDINFGEKKSKTYRGLEPKTHAKAKHLYLVTDVVAHGMGLTSDDGCPQNRDWKESKKRVYETFNTFNVIGCGTEYGSLQANFLNQDRVKYDFIDLSSIKETRHRAALTSNALLFLIARQAGLQNVELFLSFLYEKWLAEPIFGDDTDRRAKEMITRFSNYIEGQTESTVKKIMNKILS